MSTASYDPEVRRGRILKGVSSFPRAQALKAVGAPERAFGWELGRGWWRFIWYRLLRGPLSPSKPDLMSLWAGRSREGV